jgi:hypothetical protein
MGLVACLVTTSAPGLGAPRGAYAQETAIPRVMMTGVQLPDSVRYGVQLWRGNPREALSDVRLEVTLPAGADVVEVLETPGFTQYQGRQGDVLSWTASFLPGDYVDPFSFRLRQQASGPLGVRARWGGDAPGEEAFRVTPELLVARTLEGEVTLGPAGTPDLLAAGETGVRVGVAAGVVPQPTRVQVRRLGPDSNPPAPVGALWWCAAVELSALPGGATAIVEAPTRQVLPAGTEVTLFARRGDGWEQLPDKGIAGAGGNTVLFLHPGGTVAAGTTSGVQPRAIPGGVAASATPTPRPGIATGSTAVATGISTGTTGITTGVAAAARTTNVVANVGSLQQAATQLPAVGSGTEVTPFGFTIDDMIQPGDCQGRPQCVPCTPEALVSGQRCRNKGGYLTECLVGALFCQGFVPTDPVGGEEGRIPCYVTIRETIFGGVRLMGALCGDNPVRNQ